MTSEPILDEIRRVRHSMSAQIGHDPHLIVSYYKDLQQKYRDRLVNLSGEVKVDQTTQSSETVEPEIILEENHQNHLIEPIGSVR